MYVGRGQTEEKEKKQRIKFIAFSIYPAAKEGQKQRFCY